jgi:DNA-binding GntR family transcriptional regulator
MSQTPIREALRVLQADGLVDYRAHQAIVITEPSPEAAEEVYRLRSVLEPLAAELAVPRLGYHELMELERLHQQLGNAVGTGRGAAIAQRNRAWHSAIYEQSGSPLLNDFIRRLWDAFPWRTMWAIPQRAEMSFGQHDVMMEAIRAGDAAAAAELMREHVVSGRDTLLAQLRRERDAAG